MWDECCVSRGFWWQTRYDSLFTVVLCPENDRFWQLAVCSCPPGHSGNPLSHCSRAECLDHTECRGDMACRNGVCVNPCAGSCGVNANCEVSLAQIYSIRNLFTTVRSLQTRNHVPVCSCLRGYTGDPFNSCRLQDPRKYNKTLPYIWLLKYSIVIYLESEE